jgi:lipid II isoglutaminyl synthase (glutamine-hydrolysing)
VTPGTLTVAVVYPDLLGTYGDGGNGMVLARRAAWRGLSVEMVEAPSGRPLPEADVYCLGGGEDGPQVRAAESLREDGRLRRAVDGGAVVLAVCAGYQIVGATYPGADGRVRPGVGLLDVATEKGTGRRAVGEVLAEPLNGGPPAVGGVLAEPLNGGPPATGGGQGTTGGGQAATGGGQATTGEGQAATGTTLPTLTGFENHGGVTTVGPGARPLARVVAGVGNGSGDGTEGAWSGRVVGTYLHGPVLARNPALADLLLGWAAGRPLDPLDDGEESALRAERIAAAGHRRWAALPVPGRRARTRR